MLKKILFGLVVVLFVALTSIFTYMLGMYPGALLPGIFWTLGVGTLIGLAAYLYNAFGGS